MAYRLGQPLEYDPFQEDEGPVIDSPAEQSRSRFRLGEATEYDPFEHDPQASDLDEPDEGGRSLWDIPRVMGKGAAGMASTASMMHSLINPAEWAAKTVGVVGDLTQNEAMQTYRDYSNEHGVSAKLKEFGETAEKYYDEKLTPAMKASMKKTILASAEEEGFFGEGIKDPWKIGGLVAESIPSTLVSMGAGGLITKGLIRTGMKSAPKVIRGVLDRIIEKYGINAVAGVTGAALGEGGYSGLENANQAFEEMMDTPQAKLANSPTYREIYNSLPDRLTDEQKHAYARKTLAMATAGFIGSATAVTTGLLGAPSGAFMGKLIGGEGGKAFWGNLLKGAVSEGIFEEAPQSGMERLISNFTKRFLVDPNQELTEGVGEAMAAGAVAGFAMGGGMAAVAGAEGKRHPVLKAKDILTGGKKETAKDILLPEEPEPEFKGPESIEAEEEAEEFPEEELDKQIAPPIPKKEVPSDRTREGQIPSKEPQRQKPKPAAELPPGEAPPPTGGILQEPIPDEDAKKITPRQHRQAIIADLGDKAGVKLRYDHSVTRGDQQIHAVSILSGPKKGTQVAIPGNLTGNQIIERIKKTMARPAVERRAEPDRPAWDAHFRAVMGEAQAQPEQKWTETAIKRAEAQDPAILDLARRMGQTIEPDTDLADAFKTIHSRIQAGMQPRKRVEEMDDDELRQALHTDFLTGLRSKHAFEIEDERKAHVASIDLDSLKYFNDNFGHQAGDEMLINFGNALQGIGAEAYHISGDEYVVQHDDETELRRIIDEDVAANLKKFPIRVTLPDGKKIEVEVQFSYGTGQTITESEEALHAHKALREATGLRAGRGEVPRAILENLAEGRPPGDRREEIPERRPGEQVGGPRKAPSRVSPKPAIEPGRSDAQKLVDAAAEVEPEPTEGQKEAGNYKKGHLYNFMGFDITLENPKGSIREGVDPGGQKWSQKMRHHYGYFKRTEGKDGDQIDVFIGDELGSDRFFVVDQVNPKTKEFDEHKVLIGFDSPESARAGYLANYQKGWAGLGALNYMTRPQFEAWLAKGRQTKPVGKLPPKPARPAAPPEPAIVPGEEPAAPKDVGHRQSGETEKTITYDVKEEFEAANRSILDKLSFVDGPPVTRLVMPGEPGKRWIRLTYRKKAEKAPPKPEMPAAPPKEPWQMLQKDWEDGRIKSPAMHREHVRRALERGENVPSEVLADYPELAKAKPAAEPEPIPAERGNQTKIITPGNPRGYKAYYSLVEADTVIPSHNPQTFQKNPEYPEDVQERTYHTDKREQQKVILNAQNLNPDILLSDDPTPTNGPPIMTPDGIVLGGNSRAMSMQRAYDVFLPGKAYKQALLKKAAQFGIEPEAVKAMTSPMLVRTVYTEKDDIQTLHRMASDFNKALTQGMSQEAEIASMGKNISMETIEKVGLRMANRDLTLRELLGRKDGLEVLRWLIADGVISAADENRFVVRKVGLLNDTGKNLIEKAFFGSIIDDSDLISAAPKSFLNKIGRALPSLARIKARGDQWDITPQLKNALELATAAKAAELSIKEHQAQGSLFGDKKVYTDVESVLADLILKDTMTAFSKRFKNFAADAMADVKDQTFMFPPKSFEAAFKDAFDAQVREPEPPALEPVKTTGELVQLSYDDFLSYLRSRIAKTGEASGITYDEEVEVEETGDLVRRETDAIAYLNELDDDIDGWQQLVNCLHGRSK